MPATLHYLYRGFILVTIEGYMLCDENSVHRPISWCRRFSYEWSNGDHMITTWTADEVTGRNTKKFKAKVEKEPKAKGKGTKARLRKRAQQQPQVKEDVLTAGDGALAGPLSELLALSLALHQAKEQTEEEEAEETSRQED